MKTSSSKPIDRPTETNVHRLDDTARNRAKPTKPILTAEGKDISHLEEIVFHYHELYANARVKERLGLSYEQFREDPWGILRRADMGVGKAACEYAQAQPDKHLSNHPTGAPWPHREVDWQALYNQLNMARLGIAFVTFMRNPWEILQEMGQPVEALMRGFGPVTPVQAEALRQIKKWVGKARRKAVRGGGHGGQ
jgi:hypothetical protein